MSEFIIAHRVPMGLSTGRHIDSQGVRFGAVLKGSWGEVPLVRSWECGLAKNDGPMSELTRKLTVEPGLIDIYIDCENIDWWPAIGYADPEVRNLEAFVSINASAGHTYKVKSYWVQSCISLMDTTDESVVATTCED